MLWEVYVAYAYGAYQRGERISLHKTYEAAQRKLRTDKTGHWAIREIVPQPAHAARERL